VGSDERKRRRIALRVSEPTAAWSDARLISACLRGDEQAWTALIGKYKNLIYSIPMKYGARPEDAADIFQAICMELVTELPRLRKKGSFRSWLITVTAHQAYQWKRRTRRRAEEELTAEDEMRESVVSPDLIEQIEREQALRDAIARLPERCQEIIQMLFFQEPQLSYRDVARRLGLATGSIGFIRGRCLKRLQRSLEKLGF
jgi:RNA polymerase sigma factor (sigma-70 family)